MSEIFSLDGSAASCQAAAAEVDLQAPATAPPPPSPERDGFTRSDSRERGSLEPDVDVMRRHLEWLVAPALGHYDDALIEIAWGAREGGPNKGKLFPLSALDHAAAFAAELNRSGNNVYVGVTLKKPETRRDARTSGADFHVATALPVDIDENAEETRAKVEAIGQPGLIVRTGTTPHLREQVWLRLTAPCVDAENVRKTFSDLVDRVGGDKNAKGLSRVMRLAGTVSYPKQSKREKGYIDELTTLSVHDGAAAIDIETIKTACDGASSSRKPRQEAGPEPDYAKEATGDDVEALIGALEDARLRTICSYLVEAGVFARKSVTRTQWLALPRMLRKLGIDERTAWAIWAKIYDGDNYDADTEEAAEWVSENGYGLPEFAEIMKVAANKAGRDDVLSALAYLHREAGETVSGFVSWGNFTMDPHQGLTVEVTKGNGRNKTTVVETVSGPFEVLGKCRDPKGFGWGKLLRFKDADGRVHRRVIGDADLQREPSQLCATLANEGLSIRRHQQTNLVRYLCGVSVKGRVALVKRTGWHQIAGAPVFVLPDETIGSCEETVELDAAAVGPYEARGSLQEWREGVGALTNGQLVPMLTICTALSGPLTHLVNAEPPEIHIYGISSTGKSTAINAAASVWGKGDDKEGYVGSWRTTDNGLEGLAAAACDTCLVLDEIGAGRSRDIGVSSYMLGNGVGKARARADGSARDRKTWRTPVISSGEQPIEGKIKEENNRVFAGQLVRMIDLPADRGLGFGVFDHAGAEGDAATLSDALKAEAKRHYGTAGPEFIKRLLARGVEQVATEVEARMGTFLRGQARPLASEQVRRVAKRFALIAAAGEIAVSLGIVPWAEGMASEAAIWAFKQWQHRRGGIGLTEERQAIEHVQLLIERHGETRFDAVKENRSGPTTMAEYADGLPVRDRLGWRKGEGDEREWWVPPETWKAEFCNGMDPEFVARTLYKRGMLRRQDERNLQCKVRVGGGNPFRVYALTAAIISDVETDNAEGKR